MGDFRGPVFNLRVTRGGEGLDKVESLIRGSVSFAEIDVGDYTEWCRVVIDMRWLRQSSRQNQGQLGLAGVLAVGGDVL